MTTCERYFMGIDGGGTKTVCAICNSSGSLVGYGTGGSSNYHNVGLQQALSEVSRAFKMAVRSSRINKNVEVCCLGLAALDSPLDFRRVRRGVKSLKLAANTMVVHDAVAALAGALAGGSGIVVISGTGSVAAGIDSKGRMTRVGGWGSVVGDEGSAYDIGRRAITAALKAYDGRGLQTRLLARIMHILRTERPEGIVEALHTGGMSVSQIASLAPLVDNLASDGDRVSREILVNAGDSLAELAIAAASKLTFPEYVFKVSYVGRVFNCRIVMRSFTKRLREFASAIDVVPPLSAPVVGSLMLALREGGVAVSRERIAKMNRQLRRCI